MNPFTAHIANERNITNNLEHGAYVAGAPDFTQVNPQRLQAPHPIHERALNRMYNSDKVESHNKLISDFLIAAEITLTQAQENSTKLVLPTLFRPFLQGQWPDSVQLQLAVTRFAIVPEVAGSTGALMCWYEDTGHYQVPLGGYQAATGGTCDIGLIAPSYITDPKFPAIGELHVYWRGGAAGATMAYEIGFSVVYLLPTERPYEKSGLK